VQFSINRAVLSGLTGTQISVVTALPRLPSWISEKEGVMDCGPVDRKGRGRRTGQGRRKVFKVVRHNHPLSSLSFSLSALLIPSSPSLPLLLK